MKLLTTLLAVLLAACGGGSPITISMYGDSSASGIGLVQTPAQYLANRLNSKVLDYTVSGTTLYDAKLAADNSDVVIMRHGGGHAAVYGLAGLPGFQLTVKEWVANIRKQGAVPVICGLISFTPSPRLSTEENLKALFVLDLYNRALFEVAHETGTVYVDLRGVPFYGRQDLIDDVHPNQDYANRLNDAIIKQLRPVLNTL